MNPGMRIGPHGVIALIVVHVLGCGYLLISWLPREVARRRPDLDPGRDAAFLVGRRGALIQRCTEDGLADAEPREARAGVRIPTDRHGFNTQVLVAADGNATVELRDGSVLRISGNGSQAGFVWFTRLEPGAQETAITARGVRLALSSQADHRWRVHFEQAGKWTDVTASGRVMLDHRRAEERFQVVVADGSAAGTPDRKGAPEIAIGSGESVWINANQRADAREAQASSI